MIQHGRAIDSEIVEDERKENHFQLNEMWQTPILHLLIRFVVDRLWLSFSHENQPFENVIK